MATVSLAKYGSVKKCAACGYTKEVISFAGTEYLTVKDKRNALSVPVMRRMCIRCGYEWDEAPMYMSRTDGEIHPPSDVIVLKLPEKASSVIDLENGGHDHGS